MLTEADLLPDERAQLRHVIDHLDDNAVLLAYADWLQADAPDRAAFIRQMVTATTTRMPGDLPDVGDLHREWTELVGHQLLHAVLHSNQPELWTTYARVVRPCLRMAAMDVDGELPVGCSKFGGLPDLPASTPWPLAKDATAVYNDRATCDLAMTFALQINLADVSGTFVEELLPTHGVLSVFVYQDWHSDEDGAHVLWSTTDDLVSTPQPPPNIDMNQEQPLKRLVFHETLDIPATDGPWGEELAAVEYDEQGVPSRMHEANFDAFLGYAKQTTADDPTPNKDVRHLFAVEQDECSRFHIQLHKDDLKAGRFDKVMLSWLDYD